MNPYASGKWGEIYLGDCREVMLTARFRADAVITDPPYGETSLDWDRSVRGWMDACELITSSLWCFGSLQLFMEMARTGECSRWTRGQEVVWEKHNGSGFHADRFKRVHELVVHFYRGMWKDVYISPVMTLDATARTVRRKSSPPHMGQIERGSYQSHDGGPRLMRSVIYARSCHGYAIHPTQKPVEIIQPLIEYSIPVGGVVVDPFMGSGSVLETAWRMGRKGIGVEVNEKWCEMAADRMEKLIVRANEVDAEIA